MLLPSNMAALSACNACVLFSNGIKAAVVQFSCPETVFYLDFPSFQSPGDSSQPADTKPGSTGDKKDETQQPGGDVANSKRSSAQNWILASRISPDGKLVALCDDQKHLHIYEVSQDGCRLISSRCVARRVTSVVFTQDNKHVIVVDRSGDAYRFPVAPEQLPGVSGDSRPATDAREGEDAAVHGGTLLLGHLSMVLDVLLVERDFLIVTCDRDEKIRVSRYPDGFQIESYCLGHTQFVVTLAYDEDLKLLISGSGDASVRVWTLDGKQVTTVNVLDDLPTENDDTTRDAPVSQEKSTNVQPTIKDDDRLAVQSVVYCSKCRLLFVSLNKSRHVLVYRLLSTGSSFSLKLASALSGSGIVTNISVSQCVLWVTRKSDDKLSLSAYNIQDVGGQVLLTDVQVDSKEHCILQTINTQANLANAPPSALDLFPLLWKSGFQEDFKEHWKIKRASGESKHKKDQKKQKVEAAAS
uniref:tRNA (guanine-N(7)-)-methyltransferase non-catalytic subunit n=1 Tax=Biomphalaria glabrata TaxID=6526 RepID=A0A2C9LQY1_BIOGL